MGGFDDLGLRLDLLVSGWLGLGLLVVTLVLIVLAFSIHDGFGFAAIFPGLCAVIALILWVLFLVPFETKYHKVYAVEGTVLEVSNVLTESSGDLTRVPVVTLDSVDRPLTVDDPRAVSLEGREVELICTIGWVFRGADTYDCKVSDWSF